MYTACGQLASISSLCRRMFNSRAGVLEDWPKVFASAAAQGVAVSAQSAILPFRIGAESG